MSILELRKEFSSRIDLRQEATDIIEGTDSTPRYGAPVLIRKPDLTQPCPCTININEEDREDSNPSREPNTNCPICGGLGFRYTETLALARIGEIEYQVRKSEEPYTPIGIVDEKLTVLYFKYNTDVDENCEVFEIDMTEDGKIRPLVDGVGRIRSAIKRTIRWDVVWARNVKGENGRIEYIKAFCRKIF